jgi:hypothetical protein
MDIILPLITIQSENECESEGKQSEVDPLSLFTLTLVFGGGITNFTLFIFNF